MSAAGRLGLTAEPTVERYLAEISAQLPGSTRSNAGIVAELRSGLIDATEAHQSAGLSPTQAALAAVEEFGDPALVATGFLDEIAASQARRAAIALLATGPIVGLLWVAVALTSHLGIHLVPPWHVTGLSPGVRMTLRLIEIAVGVTALSALLGIAVTGRLTRWIPAGPRRAPGAAAIAGLGAIGADGLALVLLAIQLAVAPGKLAPTLATAATIASLARMDLARRTAKRCLSIRAAAQ